ncbi:hypothetical protein ACDP63_17905 [Paracoccus sp. P2]|uniref:Uncharacterized protein n=1 Tax=Paracoccus pantotrophus TaxID=82367 RepID=A0A7H9BUK9_PARPN|nr:hypothetical protein [Paracoccus pantotrophus]MDF3854915.1 hypothetical protein [Paracoccus pantotrophus]QLH15070.1 hypothetical protein HYQ43_12540 [Paracoccus pantotrophus]RDD93799.1 hypothetical protein DTW92_18665 [Paracoccus pantotrophus]RNI16033.1 hypothetical protein EB844_15995 [Paracoccus pantotrophus]WGR65301.1 hypothetical protein E3U24_08460 [Paracoccus pantotrophus]
MAGIGHNRGPALSPEAGRGFRAHAWSVARRELLGARLPVEVVRLQLRRAKALGLDYKTYAGVRATTGRDLVAFLYSTNALGVFRDGQPVGAAERRRIAESAAVPHLGCAPGLAPDAIAVQIGAISAERLPPFGDSWSAVRDRMKSWLRAQGLPGDAVLMIGETEHEREMMVAGGLAGFVTGRKFFAGAADAI